MLPISSGQMLLAGVLFGFGLLFSSILLSQQTDIKIEPASGTTIVGETFTVDIIVESEVPVNVFKGELQFDPNILIVDAIDYNTSIADLWAERPWYENGDGTLNFIGGTTVPGGFTGTGSIITITFKTLATGETTLAMKEVRILKHDGLGSDASVTQPIDAIFEVTPEVLDKSTLVQKNQQGPRVTVLEKEPELDLNRDGKLTILDTSIFMVHLSTQNLHSDFNRDGKVSTKDLSILLKNM